MTKTPAPGEPLAKMLLMKALVQYYGATHAVVALVGFRLLDHWNKKRGG
jgi:hypothetical protein